MYLLMVSCLVSGRSPVQLRGLIARTTDDSAPDHWVSLGGLGDVPFSRGILRAYPRWAEPIRVLVARAISVVLQDLERQPPKFVCEGVGLSVFDTASNRLLDRVEVMSEAMCVSRGQLGGHHLGEMSPWKVLRDACLFSTYGSVRMPETPVPLSPPVYERGGVTYCRTSDLPFEARVAADRGLDPSEWPFVPGIPDAVYPWALSAFLNGDFVQRHRHHTARSLG